MKESVATIEMPNRCAVRNQKKSKNRQWMKKAATVQKKPAKMKTTQRTCKPTISLIKRPFIDSIFRFYSFPVDGYEIDRRYLPRQSRDRDGSLPGEVAVYEAGNPPKCFIPHMFLPLHTGNKKGGAKGKSMSKFRQLVSIFRHPLGGSTG